ncbi:MAG: hypothetical protein AB1846_11465 [Chloroflexota bacterium]
MAYKKIVKSNKKDPQVGRRTRIKKDKEFEANIWVEFDTDDDAKAYTVEALETNVDAPGGHDNTRLPYADSGGRPITWLNAFQIKRGNKFLSNVWYSVLFDKSDVSDAKGAVYPFVYHDGRNLSPVTAQVDETDPSKVKIRLNVGDPGVGIIKPG